MDTLDLCGNCTLANAGYDDHETGRDLSASVAGLNRISADNNGAHVILSPETDEDGDTRDAFFSWSHCNVCLTSLGGMRETHTFDLLPN